MIIQALNQYYDILAQEENCTVPRLGYSTAKVSFVLQLSQEGEITHIIDIRTKDKKPKPKEMTVPKQDSRANKIYPYFLCDNAKNVFGVDFIPSKEREKFLSDPSKLVELLDESDKGLTVISKRSLGCFIAFKRLHHQVLDSINNKNVESVLKFIDSWNPSQFLQNSKISEYKEDILTGALFIFEASNQYIHTIPEVKKSWEKICVLGDQENNFQAQCLISGSIEPISRIHQKIKGVTGAQSAGASLISFNDAAFYSYGKEQSYNAPIGNIAEFKYTTVLNHLLADINHRIRIADSTVVFWAESSNHDCEDLTLSLLNPPSVGDREDKSDGDDKKIRDSKTIQLIKAILLKVKNSEPLDSKTIRVDPEIRFYILGLSPNNARLSVRFWHQDSFGNIIYRVAQHHLDLEIVKPEFAPPFISMYRLLQETIPKGSENAEVSPILGGLVLNAVLNGAQYPIQMYYAILNRVKVEREIGFIRAGFIKAYLLRMARSGLSSLQEDLITMSLNKKSTNVPYRLGRLFAVLEKVQSETNKEIGSTINSKYFSSASSTPAVVFPVLLKLAQHHIAKSDWGYKTNQAIEEILSEIDEFPAFLSLEEQGMFMLGYYHQKQAFFVKKQDTLEE